MNPSVPLLDVVDLSVSFRTRSGTVRALQSVNFSVYKGQTLGIVGESGSGKSVLSFAILRILDAAAHIDSGSIRFAGMDMLEASTSALQQVRGREISMIFQNPRTALNPIRRIGQQIEDVLRVHTSTPRHALKERSIELLAQVRLSDPQRRYDAYPFELSGGQCQRVMIAIALACAPALLIADEPTTGLDVTTQSAIMDLIRELSRARQMATIFITHDLALAAESCDHIMVMHAGQVIEVAPTAQLFAQAAHPYTRGLIAATPQPATVLQQLAAIPGNLPDLRRDDLPACRFFSRCPRAIARCEQGPVPQVAVNSSHHVWCANLP